uniref:Uncharacterized protein n=1 Tax=Arundo donax TaxID=35708 RepID=A0A0A9F415_ARUDO
MLAFCRLYVIRNLLLNLLFRKIFSCIFSWVFIEKSSIVWSHSLLLV